MRLLLSILLYTCINQGVSLYDMVLGDYRRNSYFIAIDVQSSEYTGLTIIENDDLFHYLNKNKGYDKEEYKAFVKEKLVKRDSLHLGNTTLKKWGFLKVATNGNVEKHFLKGREGFIKQYFHGNVIKDSIGGSERIAIISKLFKLGLATSIDDETGYLVIAR